jgi:hypothetical protein
VVVPVDDPTLRRPLERVAHALLQKLRRRLVPVRPVMQGVELDVRDSEPRREPARQRRLARTRTADDGDAHLDIELAARDDDRGTADLDALDSVGASVDAGEERRVASDLDALVNLDLVAERD